MELRDLTHDERLALVALIENVAASDSQVSDDEERDIAEIAEAFGDETYRALATEADDRFGDETALQQFLATISRPDARELIYGAVLDTALANGVDQHESSLLGWLAATWNITVRFDA